MALKAKNNATTNLASAITASDTTLTVTTGAGSKFSTLAVGEYFYATLSESSVIEIVKVTARSSDTFTVVRAQDNTAASAFTTAAKFSQNWNVAQITDLLAESITSKVIAIGQGVVDIDVTFAVPKLNTGYSVHPCFECDDSNPIFPQYILQNKTVNGFRIHLSAPTDSANYKLNYSVGNTI